MKTKTLPWMIVLLSLATGVKAQYYNLSNVTDANDILGMTNAVSDLSGGWLGIAIMLTLTIIMFIALKDYPMKEAFAATLFINAVLALLMKIMGLISDFVLFLYFISAAIAIIALIYNRG